MHCVRPFFVPCRKYSALRVGAAHRQAILNNGTGHPMELQNRARAQAPARRHFADERKVENQTALRGSPQNAAAVFSLNV
jgi:hypothetical protein